MLFRVILMRAIASSRTEIDLAAHDSSTTPPTCSRTTNIIVKISELRGWTHPLEIMRVTRIFMHNPCRNLSSLKQLNHGPFQDRIGMAHSDARMPVMMKALTGEGEP